VLGVSYQRRRRPLAPWVPYRFTPAIPASL
jgi:hypothetical protein